MDPKAVRPDRDLTGKQRVPRTRKRVIDEELITHMMRIQGGDWSRKIPTESRMLLMQLLNIEFKVAKGDYGDSSAYGPHSPKLPSERLARAIHKLDDSDLPTSADGSSGDDSALGFSGVSLKDLFELKPSLDGKRTEVLYLTIV
jgi:hypothetical protein